MLALAAARPCRLAVVALCAAFFYACSDSDDASVVGPTTGADGNVSLPAPSSGQGFQIVIGPFEAPAGQEVQKNFYMKFPSDQDVYITRVEIAYNVGSHHLNIFKSDDLDVPDRVEDSFSALQWESWDMVASSQRESLNWTLPQGVAIHLKPRQQMNFQTHYVNANTQKTPTGTGKAVVNFYTTDRANVQAFVGAIFANNRRVLLPAHTEATFRKAVDALPNDAHILWMTGHFHSWGKSFRVNRWNGTQMGEEVYRSANWDEPPVQFYNPPLEVKAGESFVYTTTHVNNTDQEVKFGPHVETEEHSNLFIYYYPAPDGGKAMYDFDGGELVAAKAAP